jgi:polyferredoxin
MRYVVLIIIIAIIGITVIRYRSKRMLKPLGIFGKISNGIVGLVAVIIFAFIVKATLGSSYTHEAVSLEFPLKEGTYYVASGGAYTI